MEYLGCEVVETIVGLLRHRIALETLEHLQEYHVIVGHICSMHACMHVCVSCHSYKNSYFYN